jgi:hypothetical protein
VDKKPLAPVRLLESSFDLRAEWRDETEIVLHLIAQRLDRDFP